MSRGEGNEILARQDACDFEIGGSSPETAIYRPRRTGRSVQALQRASMPLLRSALPLMAQEFRRQDAAAWGASARV